MPSGDLALGDIVALYRMTRYCEQQIDNFGGILIVVLPVLVIKYRAERRLVQNRPT